MNHCITSKNFIIIVISTKCVHVQLVDRLVGSFCKGSPWHVLFRVAFIGFSFQSLIWRDGVKEGKRSYHYYVPCYILLLFRLFRVYSLQRTKRKTKIMIIKRVSFHHNSSNYIHIWLSCESVGYGFGYNLVCADFDRVYSTLYMVKSLYKCFPPLRMSRVWHVSFIDTNILLLHLLCILHYIFWPFWREPFRLKCWRVLSTSECVPGSRC